MGFGRRAAYLAWIAIEEQALGGASDPPAHPVPGQAQPFVRRVETGPGRARARQELGDGPPELRRPVTACGGRRRDPLLAEAAHGTEHVACVGHEDDIANPAALE